ncbi:hypothetical protein KCP69_10700 [Salmonella enterica subsp. enterica]|nr:hypothetical protein KCP69_10700 [Salmonella enterica subsp. enterica]
MDAAALGPFCILVRISQVSGHRFFQWWKREPLSVLPVALGATPRRGRAFTALQRLTPVVEKLAAGRQNLIALHGGAAPCMRAIVPARINRR